MAKSTLSVRVSQETRKALEAAARRDECGPSSLASTILAEWAAKELAERRKAEVREFASYLTAHPDGWDDEPSDFFPEAGR